MHYRKIWMKHHGKTIPENYEIHHIDGDRTNDSIDNLVCLHIDEHLEVHREQGDWGAVAAIEMRRGNREGIRAAASKFQKGQLEKGTHNFQTMSKERRTEVSKKTMQDRIASGSGAFVVEDVVENSRRAGKIAAEKKAGFLNTKSENHGSQHVKGTYWWVNENNQRKRSAISPGPNWQMGMTYECKTD